MYSFSDYFLQNEVVLQSAPHCIFVHTTSWCNFYTLPSIDSRCPGSTHAIVKYFKKIWPPVVPNLPSAWSLSICPDTIGGLTEDGYIWLAHPKDGTLEEYLGGFFLFICLISPSPLFCKYDSAVFGRATF